MRLSKYLLCYITVLFLSLFINDSLNAQVSVNDEIKDFHVTAIINQDGTVDINEEIDYFFSSIPPSDRHGIIRTIPHIAVNEEGKRFVTKISNVTVTNRENIPHKYTVYKEGDNTAIKIGDPNRTVSGNVTYRISYKISGVITYFSDHDEFYWNVTGSDWDAPIRIARLRVVIPQLSAKETLAVACYTGSEGSQEGNCSYEIDDTGLVNVRTERNLQKGQGLTAVVSFPKDIVAVLEPSSESLVSGPAQVIVLALLSIVSFLWYLIVPLRVIRTWYRNRKELQKARIVAAWFDPPKDNSGNYFSPAETSLVVDRSVDHKDITSTVIQLAQKGFLKIVEDANKYSIEIITDKDRSVLKDFEIFLLEKIAAEASDSVVSVKNLSKSVEFGKALTKFKEKVTKSAYTNDVFSEDPHKFAIKQGLLLFSGMMTFNIPLIIASLAFGMRSIRYSITGIEKYGEARSLKNFLVSQEDQLDFQAKNQMFFERLLPYATAFGVEDIWAQRFKDIQFTQPEWYSGNNFNPGMYSAFTHALGASSRQAIAASTSSSSSGFSSGFSGGSSGGGFGGGGGRSW
jgi:uncharacterized membrane protein YgcG